MVAVFFLGGPLGAAPADAETWGFDSVGVFGGVSPSGSENYRQVEAQLNIATPLVLGDRGALHLAVHLQAAAGALWASDDGAFAGGAGPRLQLRHGRVPLWFEIGGRAGAISDHNFGEDELGGAFQFTSHAALGFQWSQLRAGARLQHTSNAGIYAENDGYNILGAVVEWGF